ncbi:MAG: hypothetical protein U0457_11435 [Candidatus Sericytochromatia bacterium]
MAKKLVFIIFLLSNLFYIQQVKAESSIGIEFGFSPKEFSKSYNVLPSIVIYYRPLDKLGINIYRLTNLSYELKYSTYNLVNSEISNKIVYSLGFGVKSYTDDPLIYQKKYFIGIGFNIFNYESTNYDNNIDFGLDINAGIGAESTFIGTSNLNGNFNASIGYTTTGAITFRPEAIIGVGL